MKANYTRKVGQYRLLRINFKGADICYASWHQLTEYGRKPEIIHLDPVESIAAEKAGRLLEYIETERAIRAITNGA